MASLYEQLKVSRALTSAISLFLFLWVILNKFTNFQLLQCYFIFGLTHSYILC